MKLSRPFGGAITTVAKTSLPRQNAIATAAIASCTLQRAIAALTTQLGREKTQPLAPG